MTNTTQRPPAKGTSDNMWNTQFNKAQPSPAGVGQKWNVRFDYPMKGYRTRASDGTMNPYPYKK